MQSNGMPRDMASDKASLAARLEAILPYVKNPGRYIGGESNQVAKDPAAVLASMVLLFPDAYEIGMSHNGTKVLYHILNREPDLAAERAFAPMPDMADMLRRHGLPLYALESYRPVSDFHAIGISLQTELNYTNVPYVLELSGLPAFAAERADSDPLIIGGGPCMANPEPVAPFFDLFVIGDGEVLAPRILRAIGAGRREGKAKLDILRELSAWPGVYVPALLDMVRNARGEWVPQADASQGPYLRAKGVRRTWVEVLDRNDYPTRNLVPHMQLVHDRFSVEVMRGCTQGCRFCQAGYWYRPNRELKADDVIEIARAGMAATGERELGLLSLSTADYGPAEKVIDHMLGAEDFGRVDLSLPSLRANSFGQGLATKVAAMGGSRSATFAPETGSERLRKLINKTISDRDMYEAAESAFANGFHNIKLYTMVGLPTEDLDDMRAFCGLIEGLDRIGRKYGKRNTVHPNIGILVPKPFTPMQWVGFMPREQVEEHIRFVRERFRGSRSVRITWADYGLAHVESFYSRGDRGLARLIYAAYRRGQVFESFSEHFSYAGWQALWTEAGYDQSAIFRERGLDEVFPWDFIHAGTNKGYLKREYKAMFKADAAPIPDCKWGDCQKCGIPGNYADIKLSPAPEKYASPTRTVEELRELAARRRARPETGQPYRLLYRKAGLSRFLAHQNTLDIFEKAFRRLGMELHYSEGFNPKPVIKNTGALPLGLESRHELLVVELARPAEGQESDWCRRLSALLPAGMEVIGFRPQERARLPRVESVTYSLPPGAFPPEAIDAARDRFLAGSVPVLTHRDKEVDVTAEILALEARGGALRLRLRTNPSGSTLSPYVAFGALLGVDPDDMRRHPVAKEGFELAGEPVMAEIR